MEQDGLDDAKNGCGCTDAKGKSQDCDSSEARILNQRAQSILEILPERLEGIPSPHFPAPLFGQGHVPEPAQRRIVSFLGRHPGFQVLLLFHAQMSANLFFEIGHRLRPAKQSAEFGKLCPPAHCPSSDWAGRRTPVMARTKRSQREVSATNCRRPAAVRR